MFMQIFAIAMFAIAVSACLFVGGWFYMESRSRKMELMRLLIEWLKRQEDDKI